MINRHGTHIWYELLSTDADAAAAFYGKVLGWSSMVVDPSSGYRRFEMAGQGVGGLGVLADSPARAGFGPIWMGYVGVTDVDATVERIKAAGGGVHVPPMDIPGVGRFAMVNDPQGVVFYVMRGASEAPSQAFDPGKPGHGEWHELHTTDAKSAFAFYNEIFGWTATDAMDMGDMGTYQMFADGSGAAIGGMMNNPNMPRPMWLYYFNAGDIDAAAARVTNNGGEVTQAPQEVPGGTWIIRGRDPQGAQFALTGFKKK